MRSHRFAAWILGAFALTATTASAAPCAGFVDVDDSSSWCTYIEWLKNRAITLGCTATQYCPSAFVRRDQMGAFLYRLGVQNAFLQGGNAFGTTATLGTIDNRAVQVDVNGARAWLVAPSTNEDHGTSPNLVGGHPSNEVAVTCAGICVPTPEPPVGGVVAGGGYLSGGANRVTDSFGFVGGGGANVAGNDNASASDATFATVSGGIVNKASGGNSTVAGGSFNHAQGRGATIAGGTDNQALGNWSFVAGGNDNEASGAFSFAAGRRSKAWNNGCFVWGDAIDSDVSCGFPNQFVARATGGFWFYSQYGPAVGARLLPGATSWSILSDRALKQNVAAVDPERVLTRLAEVPIATWNLVSQSPTVRHMGPMAQDFHTAFGLGEDDRLISTVDAQGVALAAIQGLAARDRTRADAITALQTRNAALEAKLAQFEARLKAFEDSQRTGSR